MSPTNMGLSLLANLSAHDFGYLPMGGLIERTRETLRTMDALQRYRGHFYNWYDTLSLEILPPQYVSTVDSGNLAASLLTLRAGLLALPDQGIVGPRLIAGLGDTLQVLMNSIAGNVSPPLARLHQDVEAARHSPPTGISETRQWLDRLAASAEKLARSEERRVGKECRL